MKRKKILGIFGNVVFAGQERANSDVYALLNQHYNLEVLVNRRCFHWHLQPFFDAHGIRYRKITFPWDISFSKSPAEILQWGIDVVINNIQFIWHYLRFRPDYIHIGNEYMFRTLMVPLMLVPAKINFRIGDRPFVKRRFNRWCWKLMNRKINRYVYDTNFIRELLTATGRSPESDDVVLYHPAPERVPGSQAHTDKDDTIIPPRKTGRMRFGFIGRIAASKGTDMLLDAAINLTEAAETGEIPDMEFFFAGAITDNRFYDTEIAPKLSRLSAFQKERINFIGLIEDVDRFYSSIDVMIAPSVSEEPYGLVLVEAKSFGVPAVIFPSGGMTELVTHGIDGYICQQKNAQELEKAVIYYLSNPDIVAAQSREARMSLDRLGISRDHFAKVWLETYR